MVSSHRIFSSLSDRQLILSLLQNMTPIEVRNQLSAIFSTHRPSPPTPPGHSTQRPSIFPTLGPTIDTF